MRYRIGERALLISIVAWVVACVDGSQSTSQTPAAMDRETHDGRFNSKCRGSEGKRVCYVGFNQLIAHCERYDGRIVAFSAVPTSYDQSLFLWNDAEAYRTLRSEESILVDEATSRIKLDDWQALYMLANRAEVAGEFRVASLTGQFFCESGGVIGPMITLGILRNVSEVSETALMGRTGDPR